MAHESPQEYYKVNFALMHHHNYTLEDIESMLPFEREIYITLLQNFLKEEQQRLQQPG